MSAGNMNAPKPCARCDGKVYPLEQLKCLDKIWHKGCFKCTECQMPLSMKNYKGYNKFPYCDAHVPKPSFTTITDTPENRRLAENTANQSGAVYHKDFETSKGKFTSVADDPETMRLMQNANTVSNIGYHGLHDHKQEMEQVRNRDGVDPSQQQQSYVSNAGGQPQEEQRSSIEYQHAATPKMWQNGFPPMQPPASSGDHNENGVKASPKTHSSNATNHRYAHPDVPLPYAQNGKPLVTITPKADKPKVGSLADYDPMEGRQPPQQQQQAPPQQQQQQYAPPSAGIQQPGQQQRPGFQQGPAQAQQPWQSQQAPQQPAAQTWSPPGQQAAQPQSQPWQQQQQQQQQKPLQPWQQQQQQPQQRPSGPAGYGAGTQNQPPAYGQTQAQPQSYQSPSQPAGYQAHQSPAHNQPTSPFAQPQQRPSFQTQQSGAKPYSPQPQSAQSPGLYGQQPQTAPAYGQASPNQGGYGGASAAPAYQSPQQQQQRPGQGFQQSQPAYSPPAQQPAYGAVGQQPGGYGGQPQQQSGGYSSPQSQFGQPAGGASWPPKQGQEASKQVAPRTTQQPGSAGGQQVAGYASQRTTTTTTTHTSGQRPGGAAAPGKSSKTYKAMYDYNAGDVDEVSFRDGDFIVNVQPIDAGWMIGTVQRTGKSGMLPANYVTPVN